MEDEIGVALFSTSDDRRTAFPAPETAESKGGGGSIAERRAAKFGFDAGKINTARFRTNSPAPSPAARSPYLTIPSGISPTALLDSPMMLHNSLAMPSPTTGTFPFPPHHNANSVTDSAMAGDDGVNGNVLNSSKFKPYLDHKSLLGGSTFRDQEAETADQVVVFGGRYDGLSFPTEIPGQDSTNYPADLSNVLKVSNNVLTDVKPFRTLGVATEQSLAREPIHGEDNAIPDISERSHSTYNSAGVVARTSEDGYNWRKYGQKQVKGSEYPRSYYKCTHPNCQVKKKVERSHDGQITEIIYKGAHNHGKPPQLSRRAGLGSSFSFDEVSGSEGSGTCVKVEGGSVWTNIQTGSDVKLSSDGRSNGTMEITSSASMITDLSDPVLTTHGKTIGTIESTETPELSSTIISHEDDEDGATQGSMSLGGDVDDEESESKRRKKDSCVVETSLTSRAVREPRVVVQIESDVDILDDGYRWRKYGQKVVKGNPNPRSYYKCTSAGCSVRKHVERASNDAKCVITTYEGKHNHEVPAARNGNHMNSSGGGCNAAQATASSNAQPPLALPRNSPIPKSEPHIQDFPPHFDRKPNFGFHGNFTSDARFGPPSIYQMKYPPLQTSLPYPPFGLNPNHFTPQASSSASSILPDFPMPMPSNLPPPMVGFDFNGGKPSTTLLQQTLLQQTDLRFLRPKQEQTDDAVYDACLSAVDQANVPSLSSFSSTSPAYNRNRIL